MGLIRAVLGAAGGSLADTWKDFFVCSSIDKDTLAVKGQKMVGNRSSNTSGNDNIITNGSGIIVADGQCMIIVDQGRVVEMCADPGEFTYDTSTEPSLFVGKLGESIRATFQTIGKRIAYGGDTGHDQRVYYFNTKEIIDNKFGTPNPVPFRVVDKNAGIDADISIRCNGVYSYRISDPLLFYTNVCGNVDDVYSRETIDGQLKSEFLSALQPGFAKISEEGIRYSALPGHTNELAAAMNEALTKEWSELRGLRVVSVAINSISASAEDEAMIKEMQRTAAYRDPTLAAANLAGAQAQAMRDAAKNTGGGGAFMAFAGMNMAQNAAGSTVQNLYGVGAQQAAQAQAAAAAPAGSWTCGCGTVNTGKFCSACGKPKPDADSWTCSCGTVNTGKFCSNCGKPKQSEAAAKCPKCGWTIPDPANPPKFCPNCGTKLE